MNLVPSGLTAEQVEEAKRNATPAEPAVEEYTGPYWKTRLINERPDEEVPVRSATGRVIMVMNQGLANELYSFAGMKTEFNSENGDVTGVQLRSQRCVMSQRCVTSQQGGCGQNDACNG